MKDQLFIVPSNGTGFDEMTNATIELARTTKGKLYRKHILSKGALIHPVTGETIDINDKIMSSIKENFNKKVCPIVQVPLADANNAHSEAPDRNIGEVVDLEEKDGKLYAIIDARKEDSANELGKTLLGASAMLHMNYTNTKTGEKVGPTLLHACVTNRPYIIDLEDYEEIVAASADNSEEAVLLREEEPAEPKEEAPVESTQEQSGLNEETKNMTKEEMLKALKEEHSIDVEALQEQAASATTATTELSNAVVDALKGSGLVALSNADDVTAVTKAVTDLATEKVALSNRVETLELSAAEAAVDSLIEEGRVVPSQKKAMVTLKLTNPSMFDELVPAEPIIKMSNEEGNTPLDEKPELDVNAEVARYAALLSTGK